jgi:hypothetical protein
MEVVKKQKNQQTESQCLREAMSVERKRLSRGQQLLIEIVNNADRATAVSVNEM